MNDNEVLENAKRVANKIHQQTKDEKAMIVYLAVKMLVFAFEHSEFLNEMAIKTIEGKLAGVLETKIEI